MHPPLLLSNATLSLKAESRTPHCPIEKSDGESWPDPELTREDQCSILIASKAKKILAV